MSDTDFRGPAESGDAADAEFTLDPAFVFESAPRADEDSDPRRVDDEADAGEQTDSAADDPVADDQSESAADSPADEPFDAEQPDDAAAHDDTAVMEQVDEGAPVVEQHAEESYGDAPQIDVADDEAAMGVEGDAPTAVQVDEPDPVTADTDEAAAPTPDAFEEPEAPAPDIDAVEELDEAAPVADDVEESEDPAADAAAEEEEPAAVEEPAAAEYDEPDAKTSGPSVEESEPVLADESPDAGFSLPLPPPPTAAAPIAAPEPAPAPVDADDPSERMWAAVRDRGAILTGEEVDMPGEVTDAEDIIGESSPVETGQIEPVVVGHHTTTIPAMSPQADPEPEPVSTDPTPTPRDVLANRTEPEATAPAPRSDVEDTLTQRRSLITPAPLDEPEPEREAAWKPREEPAEHRIASTTPKSLDDALFEGATLIAEVPSRTGAHWGSLLGTLIAAPIAWYLMADAGARFTLADNNSMTTGIVSALGVGELLGGIIALAVIIAFARTSSLGSWFTGVLALIVGLPWVIVPGLTAQTVLPALRWLDQWNTFGANISHHLQASGYSGRFVIVGALLIGVGIVSHSVRRRGRNEEALRAQVEKVNPVGAHFTARARRKAEKAAGLR